MDCSTPGFLSFVSPNLLKLMSLELVMPCNHLILSCPHLLLPSVFASIRVFSNESAVGIRWPKYWNLSFSISPSNEYSGLISLRIDKFDLLAIQGALKSLLKDYNWKASIFLCSALLMVQRSHPYMTIKKTLALTRWTFVSNVMSLLLNTLFRLVIPFFLKGQASLNWMAAITICIDFGAQENKVCHCFHCFPICFPWSDGNGCRALSFLYIEF